MIEEIGLTAPLGIPQQGLEIGLSYGYDIDDVIQFFNSSGKVVFSNEPEKYYNYAIYEQINFEKLIRFRTATGRVSCPAVPNILTLKAKKPSIFSNVSSGSLQIRNNGIYSKDTITGSGINLSQRQQMNIQPERLLMGNERIGTEEAEKQDGHGDYDDFVLQLGNNISVTQILINNYSGGYNGIRYFYNAIKMDIQ